jgi:hypothetical protein
MRPIVVILGSENRRIDPYPACALKSSSQNQDKHMKVITSLRKVWTAPSFPKECDSIKNTNSVFHHITSKQILIHQSEITEYQTDQNIAATSSLSTESQ